MDAMFSGLVMSNSWRPHGLCSPTGSSVRGILQKVYWSGLPFPAPRYLLDPCLLHLLNLHIFILQTSLLCSLLDSLFFFLIHCTYDLFQGTGSCHCESWQVQNLQDRPTGWRPRLELMLQFRPEVSLKAELSPPLGIPVSFLLGSWTDWMRPTLIMEGHLLYSESTDVNVNLI